MSPQVIMFIATGFHTGYLPKAPGTWGTLPALPLHLLLIMLEPQIYFIALGSILVLAIVTAGAAEKIIDSKDPGIVVIDEIIGMLIALIGVPAQPVPMISAFILFRIFDIFKPFPVSWADKRLNGGTGIVMDDVIAGIYACAVMQVLLLTIGG